MSRAEHCRRWLLGLGLLSTMAVASAGQAASPLADFRALLPSLQTPQRLQLQRNAGQWAQWTPAQRSAFVDRAAAWDALPRAQRVAGRERYRAWRALPEEQRVRLQAVAAHFETLTAQQQQQLRAQFQALDRSDRRGWLLGPELGADYPGLQPLLAQVPAAEHAALLDVLRDMTSRQRDDLIVLVQRTPPQSRATLRRALVSTPAAARDAWLWEQLHAL